MNIGLRAEAIHHYLSQIRRYTVMEPEWTVTINLNSPLSNAVEVKVWQGAEVVVMHGDPDALLADTLQEVYDFLEGKLGPLPIVADEADGPDIHIIKLYNDQQRAKMWLDYGICYRCKAQMGEPCTRVDTGEVMQRPHYGRPRFSKAHQEVD